jgi:hypothetical protein
MFLKDGRLHVYGVSEDGATIFAHYGIKSLKQIADGERAAACTQTNSLDAIDYPAALTECLRSIRRREWCAGWDHNVLIEEYPESQLRHCG